MSQKTEGETSKAPEEDGEGRERTNATAATSGTASMFPKKSPKKDRGTLKKRSASGDGDASSSKRSRDAASDSPDDEALVLEGMTPEELARMSRSERKRHREKKRRSDVNKGFDELMTLLLEIDPSVRAEAEERARRGQWKGQLGAQEDNLLSRVDLISRTVEVLRRVHRENEERKLIIASLTRGGAATSAGGLGSSMGSTGFGLSAGPASLGPTSDEVRTFSGITIPFSCHLLTFRILTDLSHASSCNNSNFSFPGVANAVAGKCRCAGIAESRSRVQTSLQPGASQSTRSRTATATVFASSSKPDGLFAVFTSSGEPR